MVSIITFACRQRRMAQGKPRTRMPKLPGAASLPETMWEFSELTRIQIFCKFNAVLALLITSLFSIIYFHSACQKLIFAIEYCRNSDRVAYRD